MMSEKKKGKVEISGVVKKRKKGIKKKRSKSEKNSFEVRSI